MACGSLWNMMYNATGTEQSTQQAARSYAGHALARSGSSRVVTAAPIARPLSLLHAETQQCAPQLHAESSKGTAMHGLRTSRDLERSRPSRPSERRRFPEL